LRRIGVGWGTGPDYSLLSPRGGALAEDIRPYRTTVGRRSRNFGLAARAEDTILAPRR